MMNDQLELGDDDRSIALKGAWARALQILAAKVNKASFESWIRPIRPLSYEAQTVTLGAASPFARDWLKKYSVDIQTALEEQLPAPVEVQFTLLVAEERPLLGAESTRSTPSQPQVRPARESSFSETTSLPINEGYTFESFVTGKSNRFAHAGAEAVVAQPGKVYNPLFIYGAPGLGKTHLLHAIGNALREKSGRTRVAFMDGENFTQQYVTALRERKVEDLRKVFRSVDVWLVDDIQFIAGKEQTKEEFFHTFNALYQTGKQIVLCSDRSPRDLRTIDERLRSRFECGLVADVLPPDLETRAAILERKCVTENVHVPNDVIFYIAERIDSNIRALQGALTRLVAYTSIMRIAPTIEVAQEVLAKSYIDQTPAVRRNGDYPPELIVNTVAEQTGLSVAEILGERRDKEIVKARQMAMYLCREMTDMPLIQIGAAIGGRDHTTVVRGVARFEAMLSTDAGLQLAVQGVRSKLGLAQL